MKMAKKQGKCAGGKKKGKGQKGPAFPMSGAGKMALPGKRKGGKDG